MSDSDDSDCAPIVKVSSVILPTTWEVVPDNVDFIFKVKMNGVLGKWSKLGYTLKKGVSLPYSPLIEGMKFIFTRLLEPEITGKVGKKEKGCWKFYEKETASEEFPGEGLGDTTTNETVGSDIGVDESILENFDIFDDDDEIERAIIKLGGSGIIQFRCPLCSFESELIFLCKDHIVSDHMTWKEDMKALSSKAAVETRASPHTNPNWLPNLTTNFLSVVVDKCSARSRQALEANEDIQDPREWNEIRNELLNTIVGHLETIFGDFSVPRKCDMREVASTLGANYPNMFRASKPVSVKKLTTGFQPAVKVPDLNQLASNLIDRFRARAKKRIHSVGQDLDLDTTPTKEKIGKSGKPKLVYGVDNKKFAGKKASMEAITVISKTSSEHDFDKRELVFAAHRPEIQEQFSNPQNHIHRICNGFWTNAQHLANHFEYVTASVDLKAAVKQNLIVQIGFLEKFLTYFNKSIEFTERLAYVNTECEVKFQGAQLYKYIMILRFAGTFFDTDGAALLRLESDGPAKTSGPYIAAKEINKTFIFSVHVEKEELLGTMEFEEAISAFIHLCFVCDLKYPKEASTLGDILQRQFAKYGDDSGTRCQGSKGKAQTKFDRYLSGLGQVLAR